MSNRRTRRKKQLTDEQYMVGVQARERARNIRLDRYIQANNKLNYESMREEYIRQGRPRHWVY